MTSLFTKDDDTPLFNAVLEELGNGVQDTGAAYALERRKTGVPLDKLGHHVKKRLRKGTSEVLRNEGFADA
jgi:hypothetical protein